MQKKKKWYQSGKCLIWIFNVGRGICAFVRTPNNLGIMIDCGKSEDFSPVQFIKRNIVSKLSKFAGYNLAQLFISHPHTDHFVDLGEIFPSEDDEDIKPLHPTLLTCPNEKVGENNDRSGVLNWNRVENKNGKQAESLVGLYKKAYQSRCLPIRTIQRAKVEESRQNWPDFEYGFYYIRPPVCEVLFPEGNENDSEANLKYVNSTSLVVYFRYGSNSILFPGDIPPDAMEQLLNEGDGCEKRFTRFFAKEDEDINEEKWAKSTFDQPSLKSLLEDYGLTVLVAPHHGLESGFSGYLYNCINGGKPELVVISEKRHRSSRDGKIAQEYQSKEGAFGLSVSVENDEGDMESDDYYSVSTRNNHHVLISMPSQGSPKIWLKKKNPEFLLTNF